MLLAFRVTHCDERVNAAAQLQCNTFMIETLHRTSIDPQPGREYQESRCGGLNKEDSMIRRLALAAGLLLGLAGMAWQGTQTASAVTVGPHTPVPGAVSIYDSLREP